MSSTPPPALRSFLRTGGRMSLRRLWRASCRGFFSMVSGQSTFNLHAEAQQVAVHANHDPESTLGAHRDSAPKAREQLAVRPATSWRRRRRVDISL